MSIPRLFKLPGYRRFNYRPLFYNPEKEAREARNRDIIAETGVKPEGQFTPYIRRGSMKSYFKRGEVAQKQSNIRLLIIIAFLLFVTYILLFR